VTVINKVKVALLTRIIIFHKLIFKLWTKNQKLNRNKKYRDCSLIKLKPKKNKMTEEALKEEKEYFEANKVFIENIEKLRKDTSKIENICIYLNSLNNYLESGVETRYAESEMRSNQNEAIQAIIKVVKELDERISRLENQ